MQYIPNLLYYTLSYIISLLFHNVLSLRLYPYSSTLYTILYYIPIPPYCTLSYILTLLFHAVHYHALYP